MWIINAIKKNLNLAKNFKDKIIKVFYKTTVKSWYLEVDGTFFYKFKLPEVQINLHFG